jgi:hypothetical protein
MRSAFICSLSPRLVACPGSDWNVRHDHREPNSGCPRVLNKRRGLQKDQRQDHGERDPRPDSGNSPGLPLSLVGEDRRRPCKFPASGDPSGLAAGSTVWPGSEGAGRGYRTGRSVELHDVSSRFSSTGGVRTLICVRPRMFSGSAATASVAAASAIAASAATAAVASASTRAIRAATGHSARRRSRACPISSREQSKEPTVIAKKLQRSPKTARVGRSLHGMGRQRLPDCGVEMIAEEEYRDVRAASVALSHRQFPPRAPVDAGPSVGAHLTLRAERSHGFADDAQCVGVRVRIIRDAQGVLDAVLSNDISRYGQSHADGILECRRLNLRDSRKLDSKPWVRVGVRLPLLGLCRAGHHHTHE